MPEKIPERLKTRYTWIKEHSAETPGSGFALEILAQDRIGLMADISGFVSSIGGNLSYIQSWIEHDGLTHVLIQVDNLETHEKVVRGISAIEKIQHVHARPTYRRTYGKRIIVAGGGAQVASVASGAITEADRHNIRGERISIDTIPIIGEEELSDAIRGVGRLHRAAILVLAGSLMGGEITKAVTELRSEYGVPVISLKMAGSVNKVSDLIVTDPIEAGVMSVMLVSHIGKFNLFEVHRQNF